MNSPDSKFHSVLNAQCRCFDAFASVKGHCRCIIFAFTADFYYLHWFVYVLALRIVLSIYS